MYVQSLSRAAGDTADNLMLSFLATPAEAMRVATVVKLLTQHSECEQYLSDEVQPWLTVS